MLPIFLALPVLVAAIPASTIPRAERENNDPISHWAPLHDVEPLHAIPNSYIVTFKEETSLEAIDAHTSFIHSASLQSGSQHEGVKHIYMPIIKGYSGHFDEQTLNLIRSSPEVEYVERDQTVWASSIQKGAPWGLARISHRKRLTLSTFQKYEYAGHGGLGVDVYVIDTGINIHHKSFEGRAKWGYTVPKNDVDEDGNGHGTHCAGTIGSKDYGVAKGAHVIAVKVLGSNGSGSMSDVIEGVRWAATSAVNKAKAERANELRTGRKSAFKGSVANLSLGGGKSPSLDRAINTAVSRGLHVAVAAGNDNKDACNYSPAGAELAVTVGASTLQDGRAYFSNWGKCVDVFAPGLNIKSTWNTGPTAVNTISGTSMASPHVAGLIAYLLSIYPHETFDPSFLAPTFIPKFSFSEPPANPTWNTILSVVRFFVPSYFQHSVPAVEEDPFAPIPSKITPAQLKEAIIKLATRGILSDPGEGSPNLLVFNNFTDPSLLFQ
ncbi:putative serine-type endopeptidase [Cantharellus anzutake]|uniref:putative serine-type endopeptidase n=1 Tax=Cantharellus anzutake TaxID=1750568 RepID=UPI0019066E7C|nr:putative serine-type endopeptidase [Cantharellus anzutake]KAF8331377.1 putative serine-type endopeptidase [Cantharellus anzutake]